MFLMLAFVGGAAGHEGVKTVGSYEYLVFCNVFKTIAAEVGLFPVTDYGEPLSSNFLKV